jgi:hypothetical protein
MNEPNLLEISAVAFLAVLGLLSLLALLMAALVRLFPAPEIASGALAAGPSEPSSEPVIAAIHAAVQAAHPHLKVTRIRETQ